MAKVKIPKKVAGVKIPKKVRKKAKKALKMAESPFVHEAAVAALGAVGTDRAAGAGNGRGGKAGRKIDTDTLKEAIREAALDGIQRFLEGFEEGLRKASAAAGEAAEAAKAANDPRDEDESSRRSADAT